MADPTIVLVHGAFADASGFRGLYDELLSEDVAVIAPPNPLRGLSGGDGESVKGVVGEIDGAVLLVGHSYGGAVITQAGDLPNVAGLVYVAAFAPDAGENLGQISDWRPAEAAAAGNIAPDSDGYVWIKQDKFRESFCQDLPADEALVMAVTQKAPVGSTFGDTISDPAWKKKPVWYQVSTNDRMIHPDSERQMAERMKPRATIELDASHASLASQPTAIADLIDQAAAALS